MKADRLKTGISLASLKTAFVPALRVRFNILLVKIGMRHILPREAVNRIHIAECQEELVRWRGEIVRSGVAARRSTVKVMRASSFATVFVASPESVTTTPCGCSCGAAWSVSGTAREKRRIGRAVRRILTFLLKVA